MIPWRAQTQLYLNLHPHLRKTKYDFFLSVVVEPKSDLGRLPVEDSRTNTHTHTHTPERRL